MKKVDENRKRLKLLQEIEGAILVKGSKNWAKLIKALFGDNVRKKNIIGFPPIYMIGKLRIMYTDKPLEYKQQTIIEL